MADYPNEAIRSIMERRTVRAYKPERIVEVEVSPIRMAAGFSCWRQRN